MFTATKGILEGVGFELITMTGAGHEIRILPQCGFNLYYWTFEGGEILMEPVDIADYGTKYGNPILFPTPNRVKNATYTWQGKEYVMTKRGQKVLLHGLVKDEPFTVTKLCADEDSATCEAEIVFAPGNDLYEGWPYSCKLTITYVLTRDGVHMDAKIDNLDSKEMPFGFAVHPYFSKRGDANKVYLTVPVKRVYEADENLIPSGKIVPVDEAKTIWDGFHSVESLYLDNVFRGMSADKESQIMYEDIIVHISGSDCFRNAVVFTPHNRPGFCIEPQTNATNFLNLHAQGFIDESGLLLIPAGQSFECAVDMTVTKR